MIGLRGAISLAIALILCVALALIGWGAQRAAEHTIVPAILAKAQSAGRSAGALMERALAAGIPADRLVGVSAYFDQLRAANGDFAEIRFTLSSGRETARSGEAAGLLEAPVVTTPVHDAHGPVGAVAITVDPSVISQQVNAVLLDVAFIGIVSLLIALELVALVAGTGGLEALAALEQRLSTLGRGRLSQHQAAGAQSPAGGLLVPIDRKVAALGARHRALRAAAEARGDAATVAELDALAARYGVGEVEARESALAGVVRPALFLFMLAEEMTRPFLPRFAQTLAGEGGRLGADLAASLPIVAFMAVVALCQIPFSGLSERLGRRAGFILGALLAALGYGLSALSPDYFVFLAARIATGIGYALVFVSAQGHVIDHSEGAARSAALAVFVRAIMVACLCGPPIGGVIADRLGPEAAFGVSAALALVALMVAAFVLPGGAGMRAAPGPGRARGRGGSWRGLLEAARAPGLMALLLGCAFPAKLLFAALCLLLVPLELQKLGHSSAAIGRFQMIYPVIMVVAVPFFAALADRFSARAAFVAGGGLVAGLGALAVPFHPAVPLIVFALAMLGVGQAMSIASQSALVADVAQASGPDAAGVLGLFRLVERSGSAVGPAGAGVLMGLVGFSAATAALGAVVVAGAALFAISGRRLSDPARRVVRATTSEGSPV